MKKLVLASAVLALFASVAEARDIATGTLMITGDTNIEISSSETNYSSGTITTDSTDINLAGVYFVTTNVGVGLMIGSEDTKTNDGVKVTKESMTMLGPIVGYNINLSSEASIMVHAGYFVANGDVSDGAGFSADIDGDGYMLGGSVNYFLNDKVAMNLGLRRVKADVDYSYSGTTTSAKITETATTIGLATFF